MLGRLVRRRLTDFNRISQETSIMRWITSALALATLLGSTAALAANTVYLGEGANGKTVNLRQGQALSVRLPHTAGTGYKWTVARADRSFRSPTMKSGVEPMAGGVR